MIWEVKYMLITKERWVVEVEAETKEEAIAKAKEGKTFDDYIEEEISEESTDFNATILNEED